MPPEFYATTRENCSASRGKLRADRRLSAPRLVSHQRDTRQKDKRYHLHARCISRLGTSPLLFFPCNVSGPFIHPTSHAAHSTNIQTSKMPTMWLSDTQSMLCEHAASQSLHSTRTNYMDRDWGRLLLRG
jgi:hypothetical protein